MTIASEANRSGPYACNGVTTRFPYAFRIYDAAHIRVILTAPDGSEMTLSLGSDYTVSGVGDSVGGAVEAAVAYAAGYQVTLILNVPFTQDTDLENQGAYFAETIERAIDLQTQMSLQLKEQVARAVVLPVTSSVSVDKLTSAVLALSEIQAEMLELAPIAEDIETVAGISAEVVAAEGHASTAMAAAGVASGKAAEAAASAAAAQTWNPAAYSTREEVETKLADYVPTGRKVKIGAGLSLDGVTGSDEAPAEQDLSSDRLLALNLEAKSLKAELWNAGVDTTESPISPAKLAEAIAVVAGPSTGGDIILDVFQFATSGAWSVPVGITQVLALLFGGGGGGGSATSGSYGTDGGCGGMAAKVLMVNPGDVLPYTIGTGGGATVGGGNSSFGDLTATGGGRGPNGTTGASPHGVGTGGDINANSNAYSPGLKSLIAFRFKNILDSWPLFSAVDATIRQRGAGSGGVLWTPGSGYVPGAAGQASISTTQNYAGGVGGALFLFPLRA